MFPYINILSRPVSTYSLCMMVAFYIVILLSVLRARKKNIRAKVILLIALSCFLGAMIGAVLLYVFITYPIDEIIPRLLNRTLSIGLVFYGGLIGGIGGAFLVSRICNFSLDECESSIVPFIPLGHSIGRIGCLLAGCCYGVEYSGFGAVYYNLPEIGLLPETGYFPVQPLEAFLDICVMFYLLWISKKEMRKYDLLFIYLFLYSIIRFFTEMLRGDEIRGVLVLSTSQWISVFFIVLFIIRLVIKKKKTI